MILVDSSSWIHFFNQTNVQVCHLVAELLKEDQVATCGPIVTEILSGARKKSENTLLRKNFELLPFLELSREDFFLAGEMRSRLKRHGLRAKTVDILIARLAIREGIPLLHHDADFNQMARHFPLKIFEGSLGH